MLLPRGAPRQVYFQIAARTEQETLFDRHRRPLLRGQDRTGAPLGRCTRRADRGTGFLLPQPGPSAFGATRPVEFRCARFARCGPAGAACGPTGAWRGDPGAGLRFHAPPAHHRRPRGAPDALRADRRPVRTSLGGRARTNGTSSSTWAPATAFASDAGSSGTFGSAAAPPNPSSNSTEPQWSRWPGSTSSRRPPSPAWSSTAKLASKNPSRPPWL